MLQNSCGRSPTQRQCRLALPLCWGGGRRHPDEWRVGPLHIQVLGAIVETDVINDLYIVDQQVSAGVKTPSNPPSVKLHDRYMVKVYKFEPLLEDDLDTF
ncbi:hypothetical protein MTO96_034687 [Rhipicephalus appendiculatus]